MSDLGHPASADGLSPTVEPEVSPLRASIPDAGVVIPRQLFDFLMGVGEIDGVSFGELNSGRLKGRFWWRALLRCAENTQEQIVAEATGETVEGVVPKSAQVGTLMYRRADVLGRLRRWRTRYLNNMREAEQHDNEEWRQSQLEKVRAVNSLFDDILERCPVFENRAKAMEARQGQDAQRLDATHDSAVAQPFAKPQP